MNDFEPSRINTDATDSDNQQKADYCKETVITTASNDFDAVLSNDDISTQINNINKNKPWRNIIRRKIVNG